MSQSVGKVMAEPTSTQFSARNLVHRCRDDTCSGNIHGRCLSGVHIPPYSRVFFGYLTLSKLERLRTLLSRLDMPQRQHYLTLVTSLL